MVDQNRYQSPVSAPSIARWFEGCEALVTSNGTCVICDQAEECERDHGMTGACGPETRLVPGPGLTWNWGK